MKSLVWNRIVLPVLFALVIALGLAQGDRFVSAVTGDFAPSYFKIDGVDQTNQVLRAIYNNPILVNTYSNDDDTITYYQWESNVAVATNWNITTGNYNSYSTVTVNLDYPSNSQVIQTQFEVLENECGYTNSIYSMSHSSASHVAKGYFRCYGQNVFIKNSNTYTNTLVYFKVIFITTNNIQPNFSITNVSSSCLFYSGKSYEQVITDAINNSESATDIADILTNSGLTLSDVRNIATSLGVTNTHLSQIQEYAFYIWEILNSELSQNTDNDFADAETKVEDIVDNMNQYNPSKPNSQQIQNDAQNRYMQLQLEEQNDSIFFYLNWQYLLPILLLVFTFAILSYILYGGK